MMPTTTNDDGDKDKDVDSKYTKMSNDEMKRLTAVTELPTQMSSSNLVLWTKRAKYELGKVSVDMQCAWQQQIDLATTAYAKFLKEPELSRHRLVVVAEECDVPRCTLLQQRLWERLTTAM